MSVIKRLLEHPLTRGLSVDDPRTTALRREIIRSKGFLGALYAEWYEALADAVPENGGVLELGSGAGFFRDYLPGVITSEVFPTPGVDIVADACDLPFDDGSLAAIVMTDVFHHIPDVSGFLSEAERCVRPGGKIVMIEPWRTPWSERIYTRLHHEPFLPSAGWGFPVSGPLSGANGALPWIVFERDRKMFEASFPRWRIKSIKPMMPFAYLASGGVSMRSLLPGWLYGLFRACERRLDQNKWAMFALIELERTS